MELNGKVFAHGPVEVPTLDAAAADPARLLGLPQPVLLELAARAGAAAAATQAALTASVVSAVSAVRSPRERRHAAPDDQTLDADGIARELGVPRRWVFRNAKKLPFVRRISRKALSAPLAEVRRWRENQTP